MRLQEFLNLRPEHSISYEDGRELHEDIALNGCVAMSKEQCCHLKNYLEVCLLHQSVEPELVNKLETVFNVLRDQEGEK